MTAATALFLFAVSSWNHRPLKLGPTLPVVKIGYFHGGRNALFYRTYLSGEFERNGVRVILMTRNLGETTQLQAVPGDHSIGYSESYGVVSGRELISALVRGELDGATVGECAFIQGAAEGSKIKAVLTLGTDLAGSNQVGAESGVGSVFDCPKLKPGEIRLPPSMLVFRQEFINSYPEEVSGIVTSYVRWQKHELSLPPSQQQEIAASDSGQSRSRSPEFADPPVVSLSELATEENKLFDGGHLSRKVDLGGFIDNHFVTAALH